MHTLKYINNDLNQGLFFNKDYFNLQALCDSDWAACPQSRSISGFFLFYLVEARSLGSLRSKLQCHCPLLKQST